MRDTERCAIVTDTTVSASAHGLVRILLEGRIRSGLGRFGRNQSVCQIARDRQNCEGGLTNRSGGCDCRLTNEWEMAY